MITQLVLGTLVAICEGDTHMYLVQDYKTDCITFYADCVIDNKNETDVVKVCQDEAKRKTAK